MYNGTALRLNPQNFLQAKPGKWWISRLVIPSCQAMMRGARPGLMEPLGSPSSVNATGCLKWDRPSVGGCYSFRLDFMFLFPMSSYNPSKYSDSAEKHISVVKAYWSSACHRPRYQLESTFAYGCHYNGGAVCSFWSLRTALVLLAGFTEISANHEVNPSFQAVC